MTSNNLPQNALEVDRLMVNLQDEVDQLLNAGKTEKALELKHQLSLARVVFHDIHDRFTDNQNVKESPSTRAKRASGEYLNQFMLALKNGMRPAISRQQGAEQYRLLLDVLTETGGSPSGSEGGFLAPELFYGLMQIQRQYLDLADYVTVADVTSFTGWRTYEKAGPAEQLDLVTENTQTQDQESPEFIKVDYQLIGYGGFLPVSNDLWNDTPINILEYLATWWSRKVALTDNALIRVLVNALTATPVADAVNLGTAVKTALQKTLDPLIAGGSTILCNQTGFGLLQVLENTAGEQLLVADYTLRKYPPVVLPDTLWANNVVNGTTPVLVGNLRELVTLFRRPYELASDLGQGASSWRNNNQDVRGIYRCQPKTVDSEAAVLLSVTIPT